MRTKTTVIAEETGPTLLPMGPPTLNPAQVSKVLDALKVLLERKGRNQSALARELRMSQASVNDLLLGKNRPSFRTAEKIAALLKIQVWALLDLSSPTRATPQTHPSLFASLDFVGDRVSSEAKDRVASAAAHLPDLTPATWIAMLVDPAHAGAPSSRQAPTKTMEIPLVPKKPA